MKKTVKNISKIASAAVALTLAVSGLGTSFASAKIVPAADKAFHSKYDSLNEVLEAGRDLNLRLAAEGFVLMKNQNNALPLAQGAGITVLGEMADSLAYGGGGSGAQGRPSDAVNGTSNDISTAKAATIFDSLDKAGFKYNKKVQQRFASSKMDPKTFQVSGSFSTLQYDAGNYMDAATAEDAGAVKFGDNWYKDGATTDLAGFEATYAQYDTAMIVLSRTGSEGADCPAWKVANHTNEKDHYQMLNDSERELFAYAKAHFEKIVVIVNSPSAMEFPEVVADEKVGAILWVGQPGWNGIMAMGGVLNGSINPSGRTVDLWSADFTTDPTFYNANNYDQARAMLGLPANLNNKGQQQSNTVDMKAPSSSVAPNAAQDKAMDYAEGIYAGYRYYETVATDLGAEKGEAWYKNVVTFPFGYGLSYTTFTQEILSVEKVGDNLEVKVKVTNTGAKAGKEVVQIYASKPYTKNGIEKAACDLVGFAKTAELAPEAEETVTVTFAEKDLASFDYDDKNKNQNYGYELEAGDYVISARKNSHEVWGSKTYNVAELKTWDEDGNPNTPNNIYSQTGNEWEIYNTLAHNWTVSDKDHYLSRAAMVVDGAVADLKPLAWLLTEDNNFQEKAINALKVQRENWVNSYDYDNWLTPEVETNYKNLGVVESVPADWKQGQGELGADGMYAIKIGDMAGKAYDDAAWTTFMNQFTYEELKTMVANTGSYQTAGMDTAGVAKVTDQDGPGQLKNSSIGTGWAWVCEVVIASTWNQELAYEQGEICGNESLWLHQNGWYGPAMNNHRSPLAGRNFEYYSQDGLQGGKIAAAVVKGATDNGCHVYVKHAFMNDQDTFRIDTVTFATEQSIREIYAKPFELAIKEGNANGTMSAFNHIGLASSIGYATNIQLYENEWGFDGYSVTDMHSGHSYGDNAFWRPGMLERGHTLPLGTTGSMTATLNGAKESIKTAVYGTYDAEANMVKVGDKAVPNEWFWLRDTAQRIMFTYINNNGYQNAIPLLKINAAALTNGQVAGKVGTRLANVQILAANYAQAFNAYFGDSDMYSVTISGLPAGLTFNASNGTISGTPTEITKNSKGNAAAATVTITVKAKYFDAWRMTQASFSINIAAADPVADPVQTALSELQTSVTALQTAGTATAEQIAAIQEQIATIQGQITALQGADTAAATELTNKIAAVQAQIDELVAANAEKGGCNGSIADTAMVAIAALTLAAAGVVVAKRKHN